MKRRILRAFMAAGEKDRLLTAAQTEQNPELRAEAVRQLGAMGAQRRALADVSEGTSVDVKRQILSAMQVGGNTTRMIELAKTEKDPELRRIAVRNLGVMGSQDRRRRAGRDLRHRKGSGDPPEPSINSLFSRATPRRSSRSPARNRTSTMKTEIVSGCRHGQQGWRSDYMLELLK